MAQGPGASQRQEAILSGRMTPLTVRRLTAGEQALAAGVFGTGVDAGRVWLAASPLGDRIFTPGAWLIVWPASSAWRDFADPTAPPGDQATLIHELTHVWQAQRGTFLPFAKLKAGDRFEDYEYDLINGPPFPELNIEQQAHVVEDSFLAARGRPVRHPRAVYEAAAHYWRPTPGGSR